MERDRGVTRCISAKVLRTLGVDIFRIDFLHCSALRSREIGCDPFHDVHWSRGDVVVPVRVIRPYQVAFAIELALQRFDRHGCAKSKLQRTNGQLGLINELLSTHIA